MMNVVWVFIGGGLGSLFRYGLSYWLPPIHQFPTGTFLANLLACLILGYLMGSQGKLWLNSTSSLLLMTGFCGGFSTFSTFSGELFKMLEQGHWILFFLYTFASISLGILGIAIGYTLANRT